MASPFNSRWLHRAATNDRRHFAHHQPDQSPDLHQQREVEFVTAAAMAVRLERFGTSGSSPRSFRPGITKTSISVTGCALPRGKSCTRQPSSPDMRSRFHSANAMTFAVSRIGIDWSMRYPISSTRLCVKHSAGPNAGTSQPSPIGRSSRLGVGLSLALLGLRHASPRVCPRRSFAGVHRGVHRHVH